VGRERRACSSHRCPQQADYSLKNNFGMPEVPRLNGGRKPTNSRFNESEAALHAEPFVVQHRKQCRCIFWRSEIRGLITP
jgi:hypothetical protein